MPIYEYQCAACGHKLDALQKFSDEPLKKCPECDESALQKQVSTSAFHLKGTGWYATDFRDKGKIKPKDTQANDTSPTDSKKDSTSE